ncbi:MAG: hypothetical protein IJ019_05915 [Alphaproteobacteria bacterium]|nr:hypothetical protein [Alphaproteobacteria bacterium]
MRKICELGRSMVEMLGVLAIIGVLSVGGIAGYSKAMFKHKLNKQTEQLNQVMNAVATNARAFNNLSQVTNTISYLIAMGEIPDEMIKNNDSQHIYDIFNSRIYSQVQPDTDETASTGMIRGVHVLWIITQGLDRGGMHSFEICKNLFTVIKENKENIYYMYTSSGYNTDDARASSLYGDAYCTENKKCLKDLTIKQLSDECTMHINGKGSPSFAVIWKL